MTAISTISVERANFSERLIGVLASSRSLPASPTALAREFNQFFGGKAITVHAARKWLLGEAIPTQDKLQALASWLEVSVDWLRFGNSLDPAATAATVAEHGQQAAMTKLNALLKLYMGLPHRDRAMAKQFITMLVRQHRQGAEQDTPAPAHTTLP
jgi:transcriptional regulator with XRE-family HTH domain